MAAPIDPPDMHDWTSEELALWCWQLRYTSSHLHLQLRDLNQRASHAIALAESVRERHGTIHERMEVVRRIAKEAVKQDGRASLPEMPKHPDKS